MLNVPFVNVKPEVEKLSCSVVVPPASRSSVPIVFPALVKEWFDGPNNCTVPVIETPEP